MHDFFGWAAQDPDRTALIMADSGVRCTRGELATRALRAAQWLAREGLQAGERFAILMENRFEIPELVLAAEQAGLYAVVINTHLRPAEVGHIVRDSGARIVISSARLLPLLTDPQSGIELPVWSVDGAMANAGSLPAALAVVQGVPIDLSTRPLGRDLLYSSGTTGHPKGVLKAMRPRSERGRIDPAVVRTGRTMQIDADSIYLSPAPLYHAAPLRYTLRVLELGGQAVIMSRFDAERTLELIERHHVTHSQWVPTMFKRLLLLPEEVRGRYDLSSHRIAIHAAAPCPIPVKQAMLDWWGDILMEYYGGSEGCGITTISAAEWRTHVGSVGRATVGRLHIVGEDGNELPAGEIGEVYFSDGGQFEYLNDPEKTRRAHNERGWATYGDLGHVDADGFLYLSDRRADLILSGGVNLYPQEIENALARHPAVDEVAVIGVPDDEFGERPLAIVVLEPGAPPTEATARAISEQAAGHLSRMKLPHRMVFVDRLPRLQTGKLLRRELKAEYRATPDAGFVLAHDSRKDGM